MKYGSDSNVKLKQRLQFDPTGGVMKL